MPTAPPPKPQTSGPPPTWLVNLYGITSLLLCILCPWVGWFLWGPWAGLGAILGSHILYMILLAPRSGICLGIAWIFVFINGVLALLGLATTALLKIVK
jgi:hypothetical protein